MVDCYGVVERTFVLRYRLLRSGDLRLVTRTGYTRYGYVAGWLILRYRIC